MLRILSVLVLLSILALVGCARDRPLIGYHGDSQMTTAPQTTTYLLSNTRESANSSPDLAQVHVHKGEAIGFESHDEQLFAIAGHKRVPLEEGDYQWSRVAGMPRTEALREYLASPTREGLEKIATVVALPFQAALLVAMLPFFLLGAFPGRPMI